MSRTLAATRLDDPHLIGRSGWLRAAVLGSNDGVISMSSLPVGVAATMAGTEVVVMTGAAGPVAGAMSMGECMSVSSQADIERGGIAREERVPRDDPEGEVSEPAAICHQRGLSRATARQVAEELTRGDALGAHLRNEVGAHLRNEVGLLEIHAASPMRAAWLSGATFTIAGSGPLLAAILAPPARSSRRSSWPPRWRSCPSASSARGTVLWGRAAMAATAGAGWLFGIAIA